MKQGLSLVLILLLGCSTMTPERVTVLSSIAAQAAQLGAQEWLLAHPDHRQAFQLVIDGLSRSLKAGRTNQTEIIRLFQSLPTSTFKGEAGDLYVSDKLVVWDGELKKSVPVKGQAALPIMKSAVSGLKRAMLPQVPMPGLTNTVKTVKPTRAIFNPATAEITK